MQQLLKTESLLVRKKNGEVLTQSEADDFYALTDVVYKLEQDVLSLSNYKSKCGILQMEIDAQVRG